MLKVALIGKKEIADNTWQFRFAKPKEFIFQPGQFTTIFLGKENRDLTICADSSDKSEFSIVTKPGISTFKKKFFSLKKGSKIFMNKPTGGFTLHADKNPKVFLAGGIGITVFYSIIMSNRKIKTPLFLIASFSKKKDIIFQKELEKIQKENNNIQVVYTITQDTWEKEMGRISEYIIKKYVSYFAKAEFMIAGGEKMVYDTEELLLKMKIPQEKIRIDIFTGY